MPDQRTITLTMHYGPPRGSVTYEIPEFWFWGRTLAYERDGHTYSTACHMAASDWVQQAEMEKGKEKAGGQNG